MQAYLNYVENLCEIKDPKKLSKLNELDLDKLVNKVVQSLRFNNRWPTANKQPIEFSEVVARYDKGEFGQYAKWIRRLRKLISKIRLEGKSKERKIMARYIPKCCVYVISNVDLPGIVKVGFTCNLDRRLKELQKHTKVAHCYEVVLRLDCVDSSTARNLEGVLHAILSQYRLRSKGNHKEFFVADCLDSLFTLIDEYRDRQIYPFDVQVISAV